MLPSTTRPRMCPRCRDEQLVEANASEDVKVDRCTKCGGFWYDRGEIAAFFPQLRRAAAGTGEVIDVNAAIHPCPVCAPRTLADRKDAIDETIVVLDCNACGGTWVDKDTWGRLFRQKRALDAESGTPGARMPRIEFRVSDPLAFARTSYENSSVNLATPAILVAVAGLLVLTGFDRLLVFARIMIHEFGHAIPAWFSGRAALPLPLGITFVRDGQSLWVTACLAFLLVVFGFAAFREGRNVATGVAAALLLVAGYITWGLEPHESLRLVIYGGTAGELLLSAAVLILFHYPMPDRLRWDFWRFPAAFLAAVTLLGAFVQWIKISNKVVAMPTMSLFGVPGDGQGDLERLMSEFAWTAEHISSLTVTLGILSSLVVAAHFGYVMIKTLMYDD